jgi:hypothetical protein
MQLTLQITAGPHAGRKVLLRSGQIARIGRTEWADFSFPRDADLAEIHFAVQCQLQGARLRKLAADKPLSVNAKEVTEAELVAGDTIEAGQSKFVVSFDGQAAPSSGASSMATITGASFVATGTAAAAAAKQSEKNQEPTALEIAEHLQLGDDSKAIAATVKTGPELVGALAAKGMFAKAVRVQAHLLPKRHAVWWGACCVTAACGDTLLPADADAKDASEAWVKDPSEQRRRACEATAAQTKFDGPGSWLAMGAFWSGGSLMPPEMSAVPPDDKLTGQAVTSSLMIAAVSGDPTKAKDRYKTFLAKAPDVASGKIPLPEK